MDFASTHFLPIHTILNTTHTCPRYCGGGVLLPPAHRKVPEGLQHAFHVATVDGLAELWQALLGVGAL